jgi:CheY-like chemotaxis protein
VRISALRTRGQAPNIAEANTQVIQGKMGLSKHRYYRLTSEGRALWSRRREMPLPADYERMLGAVERGGDDAAIRSQLADYPRRLVDGWLTEFEAIRLIEAIAVDPPELASIARAAPPPPAADPRHYAAEAEFADVSLTRLGVYISNERAPYRSGSTKAPRDTLALVLEDEQSMRNLAVLCLTKAGYAARAAESVKALHACLREVTPDAFFLDVMLPDGDGFEVLAALRQQPAHARRPIIMVTGKTEPADVARGLALGADAYVTKPYGRSTLEYVLRYVMNQPFESAQGSARPAAGAGTSG